MAANRLIVFLVFRFFPGSSSPFPFVKTLLPLLFSVSTLKDDAKLLDISVFLDLDLPPTKDPTPHVVPS